MAYVFHSRKQTEPPKWMGKLETASPRFSFTLGFLLLGFFPSDLITSIVIGTHLANHGDPWWHVLPFVLFTVFLLASGPARGGIGETGRDAAAEGS